MDTPWTWSRTVPGRPVPQARARTVTSRRGTHTHTPAHSRRYRNRLAIRFAIDRPSEPVAFPVALTVRVFIPRPVKHVGGFATDEFTVAGSKPTPTYPRSGDVDNYFKQVADALQGAAVLDDDCWIVDGRVTKEWAGPGEERVEVELKETI